jgi:hypothetical protein
MPHTKSGDFEARRVIGASRHAVDFDYTADALVGIEVNKSRVTPKNICPALLALLEQRALAWASKLYTKHFKERRVSEDSAFDKRMGRLVKLLKKRAGAYREEFLDDVEAVIAVWEGDSDSDSEDTAE